MLCRHVGGNLQAARYDGAGLFQIDPATGAITTTGPLNFEGTQTYTLAVTATDGGGLTATKTVTVTVGDVITVSTGPRVAYFKDSGQVLPVLLDADGVPYAAKRPDGSLLTLRPIGGTMLGRASDDAGRIAILI